MQEQTTLSMETNSGGMEDTAEREDLSLKEEDEFLKAIEEDGEDLKENEKDDENVDDEVSDIFEEEKKEEKEPTYKVKYNGEEKELTVSELITYAQKGMNYDHVFEEKERYKNDPALQLLKEKAEGYGVSPLDYLQHMIGMEEKQRFEDMVKTKGLPPEIAKELYESRRYRDSVKRLEALRRESERLKKSWMEMFAAYPEITKAEDIPKEVIEAVEMGKTPIDAMNSYEVKRLRRELEALKQKNKGIETTTGSMRGVDYKQNKDPFLEGLFGD